MPSEFDPYLEWLDIQPSDRPLDHYRLLGLPVFESDLALITRRAEERMAKVRSFQTGPRGPWSQKLLNELASARLCLTNRDTKATYDAVLQGIQAAKPLPTIRAVTASAPSPPPPPVTSAPTTAVKGWPPNAPVSIVIRPVSASPPTPRSARRMTRLQWRAMLGLIAAAIVVVTLVSVWTFRRERNSTGGSTPARSEAVVETGAEFAERSSKESLVLVEQEGNGQLNFPASVALTHGEGLRLEVRGDQSVIAGWSSEDDYLSWKFRVVKPGVFQVTIHYSATAEMAGGVMELAIDDDVKSCDVRASDDDQFHSDKIYMAVRRAGEHTLTLRPGDMPGPEFMIFARIEFVPN